MTNEAEFVPETPGEEMTEVLCCCDPNNFIGLVPTKAGLEAGLELKELEGGGEAFDSQDDEESIKQIPGFVPANQVIARKSGSKTWKTWKKSTQETGGDLTAEDATEFPSKIEMGFWSEPNQVRIRHGDQIVAIHGGDHDSPASKKVAEWWAKIEEQAKRYREQQQHEAHQELKVSGQYAEVTVYTKVENPDNYLHAIAFKTTEEWEHFLTLDGIVDVE